jgi:eukaryotic-like serine/threonine-protein kinase
MNAAASRLMEPARWERVKALFHSVLDQPPGERAAFLERACPDDPELLREVESLLAQVSVDSFLEKPAWQGAEPKSDEPGSSASAIGRESSAPFHAENPAARRHPFLWVVWLVTAWVIAGLGVAVWKLTQDVAVFGWSEARRGGLWQVTTVDPGGSAAGKLQSGDVLLSLNGDAVVARSGTLPYRRLLRAGASYRVRVRRGGTTLEYALYTGRRPRSPVGYSIGLAWCVIGLFIGFARPQDRLAQLAFVASTQTGLGFLDAVPVMPLYALRPLHVLGYHFFYRFPGDPPRARGWKTLLQLLYVASALCLAYGLLTEWLLRVEGPQTVTPLLAGPLGGLPEWLLTATATASMLAAALVAVHKHRALTDPDQRRRFQWVALGGVVGLAPAGVWIALDFARHFPAVARWLPADSAWVWISRAANVSSIALPLCVAYAVVKHQIFDARIVIRRGIQYLLARRALQALLALPTGALLYTLVAQHERTLDELVTSTSAYLYWILALGLSLRFRAPLLRWLDQKFFHEQYDSEQVVLSLVDELTRFDSAEEISGFVCQQLEHSLHPKSTYLWRREGGVMRLDNTSDPSLGSARFPISETLLENLKRRGTVTPVPLPAGSGASGSESRWLAERGVRLIVSVGGTERVEGVLMLGEKQSEEPYSPTDTQLVRAVAQEAAVILDNLHLKGQVRDEQRIRHDVLAKLDQGLVSLMQECPVCGSCYDSGSTVCDHDGNALTLTLPVARTIDGKYRLDRLIGRGGMGAVYAAYDLRLGREVAVKVMLGGEFGHDTALRRFRREAQAVARLNHPNIVALHDFGELQGGGAYLVMERVYGASLRADMKRVGVFAPRETAEWFEQMLNGLAAAHERGVVHRDLKPENILGTRTPSGALAVKILDFGLAKILPLPSPATTFHSVTESGVVLGTLAYMAPEQFAGKDVDPRADIYAAGVILAEMLTGRRPFADSVNLHYEYHLPPGFATHAALDAVLQRCLAMAPHERYPSAAELRSALVPALRA